MTTQPIDVLQNDQGPNTAVALAEEKFSLIASMDPILDKLNAEEDLTLAESEALNISGWAGPGPKGERNGFTLRQEKDRRKMITNTQQRVRQFARLAQWKPTKGESPTLDEALKAATEKAETEVRLLRKEAKIVEEEIARLQRNLDELNGRSSTLAQGLESVAKIPDGINGIGNLRQDQRTLVDWQLKQFDSNHEFGVPLGDLKTAAVTADRERNQGDQSALEIGKRHPKNWERHDQAEKANFEKNQIRKQERSKIQSQFDGQYLAVPFTE